MFRSQGRFFAARGAAIIGGFIYFLQTWAYAHSQESVLDEGTYLIKGLWFVTGKYVPFQDYGPLTNHMPLSFLFHGIIQAWFGPGLRTGRYFAIAVGVLMLAGLWVAVREVTKSATTKIKGEWWATLAVWAVALNPGTAKMYSLATSQVIIACLLVWALALTLGEKRATWQLSLGAGLAGVMALTRINLVPALILLIFYLFWQNGRRVGIYATLSAGGVLLIGHLAFWPGILKIWGYWLPNALTPFLDPWRQPEIARFWSPDVGELSRVFSLLQGMRVHFLAITGVIAALMFWPGREGWKNNTQFRAVVFLAILFGALFAAHAAASLVLSYCVFCFPIYLSFFAPVGWILLAASHSAWKRKPSRVRGGIAILFVIGWSAWLGWGASGDIGEAMARISIPRFKTLFAGEQAQRFALWDVLNSRWGIPFEVTKRIMPMLAGLFLGILITGLGYWLFQKKTARSIGVVIINIFLVVGLLLTPTSALGNGFQTYDCGGDVLESYDRVGAYLAEVIPPGSTIFWRGGTSAVPLLYIPEFETFPPQLNGDYTIYNLEDTDLLLKFGLWNDAIARDWLAEADYVLIEARLFEGWLAEAVKASNLTPLPPTQPVVDCRAQAEILVFARDK